jgi:hypothetical protein
MKIGNSNLAMYGALTKVLMALGCFIPMLNIGTKWFQVRHFILFITLSTFGMFIASVIYNSLFFMSFLAIIIFLYTFMETNIEKYFDGLIDKNIRGTITSIGWFFCSIIATLSLLFVSFISNFTGYRVAISSFFLFCLILLVFFLFNFRIKSTQ